MQHHFGELSDWIRETLRGGLLEGSLQLRGTPEEQETQTLMTTVRGAMLSARALGSGDIFQAVTGHALDRLSLPA